jgi:hypothetical protein
MNVWANDDFWCTMPGGSVVTTSGLFCTAVLSFSSGEAVRRRAARAVRTFTCGIMAAPCLNTFGNCGHSITSTITELHTKAARSLVIATAAVCMIAVVVTACAPATAPPGSGVASAPTVPVV